MHELLPFLFLFSLLYCVGDVGPSTMTSSNVSPLLISRHEPDICHFFYRKRAISGTVRLWARMMDDTRVAENGPLASRNATMEQSLQTAWGELNI